MPHGGNNIAIEMIGAQLPTQPTFIGQLELTESGSSVFVHDNHRFSWICRPGQWRVTSLLQYNSTGTVPSVNILYYQRASHIQPWQLFFDPIGPLYDAKLRLDPQLISGSLPASPDNTVGGTREYTITSYCWFRFVIRHVPSSVPASTYHSHLRFTAVRI